VADTFQEKTEQPTARRQKESRDEGKIPKTQELSAAVVLIGAGLMAGPGSSQIATAITRLARVSFVSGHTALADPQAAVDWLRWVGLQAAMGFLPFALVVGGLALGVGAGQGRGTLTMKPLQPDWSRLSPLKNAKRFMSPRPLVDLLKALSKVGIVGIVVYTVLSDLLGDLTRLPQSGPRALIEVLRSEVATILLAAGLALLVLAVADYGYQSWQHQRELRMTKEEVRKEVKEAEGDPLIKARLRTLGRSLVRVRMMQAVPTADVVIVNPTHVAVALRYDPDIAEAPIVVAMGSRKLALKIRKVALEAGVPVVESRPVARALMAGARLGHPIPSTLYIAVAEILAFVFRHRKPAHMAEGARA
jgi:flagellar biosynthesis protein FlhB